MRSSSGPNSALVASRLASWCLQLLELRLLRTDLPLYQLVVRRNAFGIRHQPRVTRPGVLGDGDRATAGQCQYKRQTGSTPYLLHDPSLTPHCWHPSSVQPVCTLMSCRYPSAILRCFSKLRARENESCAAP